MILRSASGLIFFGVPTAESECVPVTAADRPASAATAAPGEADSPQMRAAEQVGLFPYSNAVNDHGMKGHAA